VALAPERILLEPLRRRKPTTYFVNSMGDPFHESVPDSWIDRVFAVMALTPHHTHQVLTKRSARMRAYVAVRHSRNEVELAAEHIRPATTGPFAPKLSFAWPLPNVWLGVSAERQQEADTRIPDLLATPAAVRFVSAEPLLGPIDFNRLDVPVYGYLNSLDDGYFTDGRPPRRRLDWIIVGGESGPDARPMHPDWARSIRDQCVSAGVPFFFKQWGSWRPCCDMSDADTDAVYRSNRIAKDGERQAIIDELYGRTCKVPVTTIRYDGRVFDDRTFGGFEAIDGHYGMTMFAVGKKAAGRLLDGRTWDEMPARAHPAPAATTASTEA